MKQVLFFLLIAVTAQLVNAQNVGIGTTTPNPTAQLDVASTNKGFLIPRMTSTNRAFISNPANGLLVYDTSSNRMYQYQNGTWQYFINDNYWRTSSTRNWVYNTTDSIGIGTSVPTQRLDVNGNIRSRDNLIVDGDASVAGNMGAGNISTGGNIIVAGTSLLNGNVSTNNDLIVNNIGATLQLKDGSNVNKGFFQLSSGNLRMGTNSGNNGQLIIRMNGNDRIRIDGGGNMDIEGQIYNSTVSAGAPLLPKCYGFVSGDATINSGTANFTVVKFATGNYRITCSGINPNSIFLASVPYQTSTSSVFYDTPNNLVIRTWDTNTGIVVDRSFYFLVY